MVMGTAVGAVVAILALGAVGAVGMAGLLNTNGVTVGGEGSVTVCNVGAVGRFVSPAGALGNATVPTVGAVGNAACSGAGATGSCTVGAVTVIGVMLRAGSAFCTRVVRVGAVYVTVPSPAVVGAVISGAGAANGVGAANGAVGAYETTGGAVGVNFCNAPDAGRVAVIAFGLGGTTVLCGCVPRVGVCSALGGFSNGIAVSRTGLVANCAGFVKLAGVCITGATGAEESVMGWMFTPAVFNCAGACGTGGAASVVRLPPPTLKAGWFRVPVTLYWLASAFNVSVKLVAEAICVALNATTLSICF